MTRLLVLAFLAGCSDPITEVVVRVSNYDVNVPGDIDHLGLAVRDNSLPDGAADQFDQPPVPLCGDVSQEACFRFPMTVTLVPGPSRGSDPVRVELQALLGNQVVIDEAAILTFRSGARERLEIVLYRRCLGTGCAGSDQACGAVGECLQLQKTPLGAVLDLSATD